MLNLQRITTEYHRNEDRIALSAVARSADAMAASQAHELTEPSAAASTTATATATEAEQSCVLWLTQRFLLLLVPHLLDWLDQQSPEMTRNPSKDPEVANLLQVMAQQSARARLTPEAPVQVSAGSKPWLVEEVDINSVPAQGVRLLFKTKAGDKAGLVLDPQQLRQWLLIVYSQWQQAQWPLQVWPDWISSAMPADDSDQSVGDGSGVNKSGAGELH